MSNPDEISILAGLLDFYSDRASAHASFVVAELFGIYTILLGHDQFFWLFRTFSVGNIIGLFVFALASIALLVVNIYTFLNFGYYSLLSEFVRERLEGNYLGEHTTYFESRFRKRSRPFDYFKSVKKTWLIGTTKYLFLFLIWFFALLLPFLWVFFVHLFALL